MFNLFSNSQQQSSGGYVSDYPPVFFTNSINNGSNSNFNSNGQNTNQYNTYVQNNDQGYNQNVQQQGGFLSSILNSDIFKQLVPLLLGGKLNFDNTNFGGSNIISVVKNIFPNIASMLKVFDNNKKNSTSPKVNSLDKDDPIIDMTNYEEIKE